MKRLKLLALLAVFALFAAACGGSDGDSDETATTDDDTTQVDSSDEGDSADDEEAMDDEEEAMDDEEEAMDDEEEAMDDEEAMADSTAGQGGELLLLQWQAPSQANPWLSGGTKDLLASSIVLEPLARFGPDGELVPTLADFIPTAGNGISDDGTEISWTLKEGIMWSDGTPLTADDFVFTYEYCVDEATGCGADLTIVENVTATDDRTVTVTFVEAQPFPYSTFVGYQQPVIQRAQFQDCVGEAAAGCSEQNFAPIGTGPYMVTELRPEDTVTYEYNPNFRGHDQGQPFFGNVTIKGGGDAEASARSVLEIGEADYAWNLQVAPEILGPMEDAGNGEVVVSFTANVEHINLNQTDNRAEGELRSNWDGGNNPNPFFANNPDFARALSLAINRDELVIVGYGATGIPTCNMWNVGAGTSTNNDWCLTQDIDEANRILDEDLGYLDTDGDGVRELPDGTPLEFDYVTSTNAVRQSNQDLIKGYWEEIGVVANMQNVDASLFFDGTCASDDCIWKFFSDMEMFTNGASNPDPAAYLRGWTTDQIPTPENAWGTSNMPRISNAELDETWEQLNVASIDDPARNELTIRVNDLISAESGGVIPLISRGSVSAFGNDIANTGPLNGWDSEYWNIHEWTRE